MKNIFYILLFFTFINAPTQAQLLNETELNKKPIYTNLTKAFREYQNVYRLRLQGSGGFYGKVTAIHDRIDSLENLQYIHVVNQSLKTLPLSIGDLPLLQQLYLSGNQLKAIPDTVFQLRNLKKLDLSHNQLTHISDKIKNLENLEYLYLKGNTNLDFLPTGAFARLFKLKLINIQNTRVPKDQIEIIRKSLPGLRIEN